MHYISMIVYFIIKVRIVGYSKEYFFLIKPQIYYT